MITKYVIVVYTRTVFYRPSALGSEWPVLASRYSTAECAGVPSLLYADEMLGQWSVFTYEELTSMTKSL